MKIKIAETTIASKDVKAQTRFYQTLLGEKAEIIDSEFFFQVKDPVSGHQICLVPHNGDPKWDAPWLTFYTDDLNAAIAHLKSTLTVTQIENFGDQHPNGEPKTGVCFIDPEGHLMMLLYDDEL